MARLWLRWFILTVVIVMLAACSARERGQIKGADATPGALPPLVGTYAINGFDPLGVEYGGTLAIEAGENPDQYRLHWIVTGSLQEGTGRTVGNQLLVQWQTIAGLEIQAQGVATYTITTLGELYGQRKVFGLDGLGRENAFPNE